jgi:hypothetical protein
MMPGNLMVGRVANNSMQRTALRTAADAERVCPACTIIGR